MTLLRNAALALCLLAGPAWAQGSPSVEDIISRLKIGPAGPDGTFRGIRSTGAAAPAPAGQAHAAQPVAVRPAPAIDLVVVFATNSAELTQEARAALANLGSALSSKELAGDRFRIEGHTDTVGTAETNLALSARRAEAVAAFLKDGYGVAHDRLVTVGLGFSQPAVVTPPGVDEPRNRRVRVVNITQLANRRCEPTQRCQ